MRYLFLMIIALVVIPSLCSAQNSRQPIYVVNGKVMTDDEVQAIDPEDIVDNVLLPADEESIARYGQQASNGVVVITLRYDTEAMFVVDGEEQSFSDYIASQVKWGEAEPVARVIISYTVDAEGRVCNMDTLEATDRRLERRIVKAMESAPAWQPALKDGQGVLTRKVLRVTLPRGKRVPPERVILMR